MTIICAYIEYEWLQIEVLPFIWSDLQLFSIVDNFEEPIENEGG